jgi:hypothetical protein
MIQLVIQIPLADGSVFGTKLNSAVLALMDAGFAMRGLPVSVLVWLLSDEMGRALSAFAWTIADSFPGKIDLLETHGFDWHLG